MRKLIGNVVIVVLIVVGIGYFRGWFTVTRQEEPGQTNVEVKIDKEKVKDDADEVARKARELRDDVGNAIHDQETSSDDSPDETSQP